MSAAERALTLLSWGLLLGILAGIGWRRRVRYSYSFALYIATQVGSHIVNALWPQVFRSWRVWAVKETAYALIRLWVLVELTGLIFRALPRARRRARVLLLVTGAILAVVLCWPYDLSTAYAFGKDIASRFSYVTACGLMAPLALVTWYRLPLHHFHKTILHGMLWLLLAQFAAVYAAHWSALGSHGAGVSYHLAQIIILVIWLRAAWAPEAPLDGDELAVIDYLQPWRKP
jgi:hypothetical protein